MEKKLYRVMKDKKIAGVCTGIAEYFKLDVTIIRLVWVLFTLCGGAGIVLYIIAALLIPEAPVSIEEPIDVTNEQ